MNTAFFLFRLAVTC